LSRSAHLHATCAAAAHTHCVKPLCDGSAAVFYGLPSQKCRTPMASEQIWETCQVISELFLNELLTCFRLM
jgi:hypothetical protein